MLPKPPLSLKDKFAARLIHRSLENLGEPLSAQTVLRNWMRFSPHSGTIRSRVKCAVEHLDAWIRGEISYDQADQQVRSLVETCLGSAMKPRELFALRQLISSCGFFFSSAPLLHHGAQMIISERGFSTSVRDLRRHLRAALLLGDTDVFIDRLSNLAKIIGQESDTDKKMMRIGALLANAPREFDGPGVIVVGPSEVDESALNQFPTAIRAQVLIPTPILEIGKFAHVGPMTVFYANGETTDWLSALPAAQVSQLLSPRIIVRVKKRLSSATSLRNVEEIIRSRDLFLTGNPNLVPMAILDLLLRGETGIFVTGANFWFGPTAYRDDQRRFRPEFDRVTDSFGSLGGAYERCIGLASHDQIANRNLIRTFVGANVVSGDEGFLSAVNVPEEEYLRHLDLVYGRSRR